MCGVFSLPSMQRKPNEIYVLGPERKSPDTAECGRREQHRYALRISESPCPRR
jgi:hypothetical protein